MTPIEINDHISPYLQTYIYISRLETNIIYNFKTPYLRNITVLPISPYYHYPKSGISPFLPFPPIPPRIDWTTVALWLRLLLPGLVCAVSHLGNVVWLCSLLLLFIVMSASCSSGSTPAGSTRPVKKMRDQAYRICRDYLSGSWKSISSSDMVFRSVRWVWCFCRCINILPWYFYLCKVYGNDPCGLIFSYVIA